MQRTDAPLNTSARRAILATQRSRATDDQNCMKPRDGEGLAKAATRPDAGRQGCQLVQSFLQLEQHGAARPAEPESAPRRSLANCRRFLGHGGVVGKRLPISAPRLRPAHGRASSGAPPALRHSGRWRTRPPLAAQGAQQRAVPVGATRPVACRSRWSGQQRAGGLSSSAKRSRATGWLSRPRLGSAGARREGGLVARGRDPGGSAHGNGRIARQHGAGAAGWISGCTCWVPLAAADWYHSAEVAIGVITSCALLRLGRPAPQAHAVRKGAPH